MNDQLPPGYVLEDTPDAAQLPAGYVLDDTPAPIAPAKPSAWADVPASLASGVARGVGELAMTPITVPRMIQSGTDYLARKGDDLVRHIMGADPISDEQRQQNQAAFASTAINKPLYGAQDAVRGIMDDNLYAPKTTPGKYAETVGEFVPAALAVPSSAARALPTLADRVGAMASGVISNAVVPGVASEAAGQATAGTSYEPAARFAGALAGNVAAAGYAASNAPEAAIRRAVGDTPPDWAAAQALQGNRFGVQLTGPEAIAQATGGASALPNLQRVVEGSTEGRAATAPFFAARPGQVDRAVGGVLDRIAPQSNAPSTLGPRASESATGVLDGVRQDINATTRPLYQAAEPQLIPDAQFAPIQADPRFAAGLARLRGNAEIGPDFANLPDNSIGVVDAVTKDLTARGEAMSNQANPLYGPYQGGRNTESSIAARDIARDPAQGGSAEYDQALATQAQMRRDQLEPLQQGPVGRIANATDTPGAAEALLPRNPLVGSRNETLDAATRLNAADPQNTAALARQALADRYSTAATNTQGATREFTGAKFARDVGGNVTRQEVLDAVLEGLNSPARADVPELLQVLEATGRRAPVGSNTSFNNAEQNSLGAGSPMGRVMDLVRSGGTSLITKAGDAVNRARLSGNLGTLADMFTDPHSVELIQAAYGRRAPVGLSEALARTAASGGSTSRDRSN